MDGQQSRVTVDSIDEEKMQMAIRRFCARFSKISVGKVLLLAAAWPLILMIPAAFAIAGLLQEVRRESDLPDSGGMVAVGFSPDPIGILVLLVPPLALVGAWLIGRRIARTEPST